MVNRARRVIYDAWLGAEIVVTHEGRIFISQ